MSHLLLAAPFVGEVGWELMAWQGRVRRAFRRGRYDRLIVLGSTGKEAFYADMPGEYRAVDPNELPGVAYEDRRWLPAEGRCVAAEALRSLLEPEVQETVRSLKDAHADDLDVLWPNYDGTFIPCDARHQDFICFDWPVTSPLPAPTVVLVKRQRAFRAEVNWSAERWDELAERLRQKGVHTIEYPCDSAAAIAVLSHADLAVGQSTGGMHLAALCGCPRLVWSMESYLWSPWEITNRQRYETVWNPLAAPTEVREVMAMPDVAQAATQVLRSLDHIGRRTGSTVRRASLRAKWAVRSAVMRHVIQTRACARWPWPMQRFVRYQLI